MSYLTPIPTAPSASEGSGGSGGNRDQPVRVRIPADLDTPDRVAFGLTLRQFAVVGVFAVPAYLAWQVLTGVVPLPALAAGTAPLAAVALVLAVGRRDGLPLDAWLLAAITHRRRPGRLSPTGRDNTRDHERDHNSSAAGDVGMSSREPEQNQPASGLKLGLRQGRRGGRGWTKRAGRSGHGAGRVGVLRLPVEAIGRDGVITTGSTSGLPASRTTGAVVLVAVRTVTSGLHTPAEQSSLLGGYARWLNQLSGPTQVVVSTRPVDLPGRALRIAQDAARLPHPALAQAALEHAEHLLDLCEDGEPRVRTVTIACTAHRSNATATGGSNRSGGAGSGGAGSRGDGAEALRRGERTVAALSGLGAECLVLDGRQVSSALAAAIDPFGPAGTCACDVHGDRCASPTSIDPTLTDPTLIVPALVDPARGRR